MGYQSTMRLTPWALGAVAFGCLMALAAPGTAGEVETLRLPALPAQAAAPTVAAAAPAGSVVVVPFTNISGAAADDWIGAGIAETLRADLQALGLSVLQTRSESGTTAPAVGEVDVRDAAVARARRLGARWVVVGGYQRVSGQLRITARLVDVASGVALHSVKADGGLEDIFDLQDRIVTELMSALGGAAVDIRAARRPEGRARTSSPAVSDPGGLPLDGSGSAPQPAEGVSGGIVVGESTSSRAASGRGPAAAPRAGARPGGLGIASEAGILTGRPRVSAIRASVPPRVDGRLDDAIWQDATRITEFVQQQPRDGAPASEQTEVYVAYDSSNLYIGVYAHYSDPAHIRANRSDRDRTFADDTVSVFFDTFLDQQRAYVFSVNGYGVQGDSILDTRSGSMGGGGGGGGGPGRGGGGGIGAIAGGFGAMLAMSTGGTPRGDTTWDALFDSGGTLVDDGWTAEMAIPFKSLRYPTRRGGDSHRWGFQIVRTIPSKDETDVWAPVSRDVAGFLTQMGLLDGLTNLSTSRNLEFLPTATAIRYGELDTGSRGLVEETQPEGAMNVKYGVTPNMTFDFTYNPDFSQIESDSPQIEVNQRFPLFFPELRPFFLEGQEIFRVPGQVNLVHTRTLGDPRYGAKLTGKVGKTTVGLLVADDEAPGRLDDRSDPAFGTTATTFIGRARYDLYAESYVGVIATDREFLDGFSRVAGIDGRLRLTRASSLSFEYAASQHRDQQGAELSGPIFHLRYNRRGRNLAYSASIDTVDPEFRTDTGFVRRVDTRTARANVSYRWWPNNLVINWGPSANYSRNYDFAGVLQDEQSSVGLRAGFQNGIIVTGNLNRDMERFLGHEFYKTTYFVGGGVNASRKVAMGTMFTWGDQVFFSDAPFLGRSVNATIFAAVRPMARLNADLLFISSRFRDPFSNDQIFDVKIGRALTTYQFTNRLSIRNILEYNAFTTQLAVNFLATYRVNSGTVFFVGYDDHYQQGHLIDATLYPGSQFQQTNRAFFTKISYLFRM